MIFIPILEKTLIEILSKHKLTALTIVPPVQIEKPTSQPNLKT